MRSTKPIAIIDYGSGNLQSIINALNYLKIPNKLVNKPEHLYLYEKAILPGVGSFKNAMKNLKKTYFSESIIDLIRKKKLYLLGICLGMQLFYDFSEEDGGCKGLGIVPGIVKKIQNHKNVRVPNIGWRKISKFTKSNLLHGIKIDSTFYFVHSYACNTADETVVTGKLKYGKTFDVLIEAQNVLGAQFHPEKSQDAGLKILKNFSNISLNKTNLD